MYHVNLSFQIFFFLSDVFNFVLSSTLEEVKFSDSKLDAEVVAFCI